MIIGLCTRPVLGGLRRSGCLRPLATTTHRFYSSSSSSSTSGSISTVPLAYDLHAPAKPVSDDPDRTSPILFLHGLFGSKKNNRSISKALARDLGRSIYAIDLRNHGESPHDPRHDYLAMAEDVGAFMAEHQIDNPTIIGHSMGAKAAMTLALRSPRLVKDVVAVDNAPVDAILSTDFAKYVRNMKKIEDANVTSLKEADAIMAEVEESIPIRQFLLGNLHTPAGQKAKKFRVPIDILGKALAHMGDFPYKEPGKVRFGKRALFIRGTKSKYVPDEVLPVVGEFFPLFEVVDVEGGHWVISENPEAFRQAPSLPRSASLISAGSPTTASTTSTNGSRTCSLVLALTSQNPAPCRPASALPSSAGTARGLSVLVPTRKRATPGTVFISTSSNHVSMLEKEVREEVS
ncbi:hypothetical protein VMCG_02801 [Cytospora schulzeri]|uniref:AB hydrolase-1 domain-containing protein n=1 Tax=Cytospora schulzeri TaxID=448051 RepID=A0A423WZH3_9PEZI|nr:hypothetical protein VMCG_02801 [Valsa malicola]